MMEKFIAFVAGDPYKMDESWQQTWAYFVGCKMPYILRDWHDPSFREGDVWKKDGAFYESLRLKLDGMSAFKKKCDDSDDTLEALELLVEFFAHERSKRAAANSGSGRVKKRGAEKNGSTGGKPTRDTKNWLPTSQRWLSRWRGLTTRFAPCSSRW